jgi:hypothetical protein
MRILHEALRPPDGHELEQLVVTTFTLDLVSLLSVPLAFAWFGVQGDSDAVERDPLELLAAVERQSGRITVFHQAGAIAVPGRHRQLLSLVEDALTGVPTPRAGGVFHPKLWIAAYHDQTGDRRYRLLCLSRNLTADRCWDTILSLEGSPTAARRNDSEPLADFVTWLARRPSVSPARAAQLRRLGRELRSVRFDPPPPFERVQFRPLGIRGYRNDPIAAARRDRLLVVSPFLGADQLERLAGEPWETTLVTRAEEAARLHGSVSPSITRVLQLDDALEAEPDDSEVPAPGLAGLHAKFYVADQGWNATMWTGSANATSAAFKRNVEFFVELHGKKSTCGIDKVLGDGSDGTFASMLVPVEDMQAKAEDDSLERRLDALAREIAELPLEVRVSEKDDLWTLELARPRALTFPPGASVTAAPLTLQRGATAIDLSNQVLARFQGLKAHEVSGLFVLEVRLDIDPKVSRCFVAHWPLVGMVPDRVHALLVELASDPERVLAFVRLFLAGDEAPMSIGPFGGGNLGGNGGWGLAPEAPLLELLVRALAREPQRLDDLARWLPDMAAAAGDPGADLLRIWEPVWQARQERAQ